MDAPFKDKSMKHGVIILIFSSLLGLLGASQADYIWQLPKGFPMPLVPENNPMTKAKVELGRYLFYDPNLSGNGSQSCSSCHLQELAFSDGLETPIGSTGERLSRNSPSLSNVAYNATLTWANPVLTELERHILVPMFGEFPVEMGMTGKETEILTRFKDDPLYQNLFAQAYPDDVNPVSIQNIVLAITSFSRTLISGNSAYDQFVYQKNFDALSESAKRGMDLFFSERTECHHCHGGFNLTHSSIHQNNAQFVEMSFHNTGLYNLDGKGSYPLGNRGLFEVSGKDSDMGMFRAPSLRNIALTAPYLHDGSAQTLEEVIRIYEAGGRLIGDGEFAGDGRKNPYKSGFVQGFSLTDQERQDLIAFLESLTDTEFINNPAFSNPF